MTSDPGSFLVRCPYRLDAAVASTSTQGHKPVRYRTRIVTTLGLGPRLWSSR